MALDIMTITSDNMNNFVYSLTEPTFYYKLKHFLNSYLSDTENTFIAFQNPTLVQKWKYLLKNTDNAETVYEICDEMYNLLFNTGEYENLFNMFNVHLRKLFGGMFGMNCDYWTDLGMNKDATYDIFHFEKVESFQKIQVLMCYELFWGNYGTKYSMQMANYKGMWDDLYTTISMSEFTPYYLEAIDVCITNTPAWFISTIVNIIMHTFKYIKNTRKTRFYSKTKTPATLNAPMWREYYNLVYKNNEKRFSMSANEILCDADIENYDEKYMDTLIPTNLMRVL
jgi:hypothetical protein